MSKTSLREPGGVQRGGSREKKREEWGKIIEEWKGSDLSQGKFCTQAGISYSSFKYWKSRIGEPEPKKSGGGCFIPVVVEETQRPSPLKPKGRGSSTREEEPRSLEILFEGGERIAIGRGFDAVTLRRVIDVMRGIHA